MNSITDNSLGSNSHDEFRIANDPGTASSILEKLAASDAIEVLSALALNPSTPLAVIHLLAQRGNYELDSALQKRKFSFIHPTSIVSSEASLGHNVKIGPFTIIHGNTFVGDETVVESNCEIGYPTPLAQGRPLTIGKSSLIRSHSIFYEGSTFGDKLVTGHRVTVRENTLAGENLQIGTLSDIQGHCEIGDYVRLHSNVHIGQHSRIGSFVWIFPYVVLTNDPHPPSEVMMGVTIEDFVAIATMSVVLPGVTIGKGALVGAHSSVARNVEPDVVVAGVPSKVICSTDKLKLKDGSDSPAYPWRKHFHRGYPEDVVTEWVREFS